MSGLRTTLERIADVSEALSSQRDLWVATADSRGAPYLVPLSFLWDGADVILSTPVGTRTARNLRENPTARLALGADLEDVILIDVTARILSPNEVEDQVADDFASKAEFEPRDLPDEYVYIVMTPGRVLAWRSEAELEGRTVMRDGDWLG